MSIPTPRESASSLIPHYFKRLRPLFWAAILVAASACSAHRRNATNSLPTYDPFIPLQGGGPTVDATSTAPPTRTPGPTPTRADLTVRVPTRNPESSLATPTADRPHSIPTARETTAQYTVQAGDTLGSIAAAYGVSVAALQRANSISDQDILAVGETLEVPASKPSAGGPSFKIVPDSELVYGPAAAEFDVKAFVAAQGGYLSAYTQDLDGTSLDAGQVVQRVAQDYSVNPRLLLALLEYRSQWLSKANPGASTLEYPLGFVEPNHTGLYHQLAWAANGLNRGFYLWRAGAVGHWVLQDGTEVQIDPTINAGTAGVQSFFAAQDDIATWRTDVSAFGLFQTYFFLYGNPFDLAIEPLAPVSLSQPHMELPFEGQSTWAFTGGPHAAWDSGSAWGALDFAPADVQGCAVSQQWVTAAADGLIVRADHGAVIEDLDGDGYEQTGWDVLYMHMAAQDRVQAGTYVYVGDRIGHPSCEGGIANAAHLHLARKYNGEWIAADGIVPFVLGGWTSSGNGIEYDGFLRRGSLSLEAAEGISGVNQVTP
jgi:LasA protease